jgi:hypothetical protein
MLQCSRNAPSESMSNLALLHHIIGRMGELREARRLRRYGKKEKQKKKTPSAPSLARWSSQNK